MLTELEMVLLAESDLCTLSFVVMTPMEPMSGLALFLIVFFSLVAIVFAIVIGVIVYNKWQERSRKHFY